MFAAFVGVLVCALYAVVQTSKNDVSNHGDAEQSSPATNSFLSPPNTATDAGDSISGKADSGDETRVITLDIDAVDRLGELGIDTSFDNLVATLSNQDSETSIRYLCAIAIGQSRNSDSRRELANALDDEDIEVRHGVVTGLGLVGDVESVRILSDLLNYDPNQALRGTVISALYRANSDQSREVLSRAAADQTQEQDLRLFAIEILGLTQSEEIANTMRILLVDEHPQIRASAAVELSRHYEDEAVFYLVTSAQDDSLPVYIWGGVLTRLQEITGKTFGSARPIDYASNPVFRAETKIEIQNWWQDINPNHF